MREHGQGVACAVDVFSQPAAATDQQCRRAGAAGLLGCVIKRKLSCCTRSKRGMDFIERIFSMVQTWKMQPRVAYHFITDAVQSWCGNRRPLSLKTEHSHLRHICV